MIDKSYDPQQVGPLNSFRVLDLSRLVCGNALTAALADFGADVIKVEDARNGDSLRDWQVNGISFYWKVYARNKRSLSLNLRTLEARALLLKLVETSDCLVESFRHGTLEKWNLGPDVLLKRNPKLVIVRVSGWGQTGPYRTRPGFGTLVEAFSGFAHKSGFADKPPLLPNIPLADQVAAITGAFATVVALRHAEQTGTGQVVDLSLLEPLHAILGPDAAIYASTGEIPARTGSQSLTAAPRNIYRCSDGHHVALSAAMQSMATRLLDLIGGDQLVGDVRFQTNHDRVKNVEELDGIIGAWIGSKRLHEVLDVFEEAGITAGPIYDPALFSMDRHVVEREVLVRFPDPEVGDLVMHNVTPRLSKSPGGMRRPAPAVGEHTAEVLGEIGMTEPELERLEREGVIHRNATCETETKHPVGST